MPNTPAAGSRHVIRTAMQQLEAAGLVELVELKPTESVDGEQMLYKGRVITGAVRKSWTKSPMLSFHKPWKPTRALTSTEVKSCPRSSPLQRKLAS